MFVVHHTKDPYDVFIGRRDTKFHYGNPFTHLTYGLGSRKVASRKEAIVRFRSWLNGTTDTDLEQERRQWILDNIPYGKTLGCFCKPLACHGDVLAEYERRDSNDFQSQLPGFVD
jgi:hypothetical protein